MKAHRHAIQALADAVVSLEFESIPGDVLNQAKRCVIDVCGVTLAGAKTESAKILFDTATETYGAGCCDIVGTPHRLNAPGAAFANGTAAHALDFDDNCYAGIVHGSAVVFPAVLAVAQQRGATGAELLLGFLAGLEVEFAVAKALSNSIYDKGWWTTSVLGVIGSAAGAAKIAGLDREKMEHTLALAAVGAGATRAVRGTAAKHYYCGRAAESGVIAAIAAMHGATGPANVFEDQSGFAQVLNGGEFDAKKVEGLGIEFGISDPGVDIKKYPVCYASHAAADAVKEIMGAEGLRANDIVSLTCTVPSVVASNLTYPAPRTPAEAQFSLHFAIAAIIVHGDITLEHLTTEMLSSAPIKRLLKLIEVKVGDIPLQHRSSSLICPEWGYVELTTRCGDHKTSFVGSPLGSASRPMSEEMLKKKFNACAQHGDYNNSASVLYDKILNIENLQNARDLFS
ncbi:MAG: MmgE/PrpD family protein [Paracoccaceae bacterium]|nr:MmgE/PrpD family protein [Paracoccaceae bacterium]MDG1738602.1 MmgE/PrpD family protein [Paracoccaceae bacterium]MDG2257606.1 MmgE/PrpD family protein [Paracoccaceae bacterium]